MRVGVIDSSSLMNLTHLELAAKLTVYFNVAYVPRRVQIEVNKKSRFRYQLKKLTSGEEVDFWLFVPDFLRHFHPRSQAIPEHDRYQREHKDDVFVRLCEHFLFPPFAKCARRMGHPLCFLCLPDQNWANESENALALFRNLAIIAQSFSASTFRWTT